MCSIVGRDVAEADNGFRRLEHGGKISSKSRGLPFDVHQISLPLVRVNPLDSEGVAESNFILPALEPRLQLH